MDFSFASCFFMYSLMTQEKIKWLQNIMEWKIREFEISFSLRNNLLNPNVDPKI